MERRSDFRVGMSFAWAVYVASRVFVSEKSVSERWDGEYLHC
jgi:hypothetical protein